jgi:6-pyruvoyltetrahydropterin/6-carboxytetrahydropterin synthase
MSADLGLELDRLLILHFLPKTSNRQNISAIYMMTIIYSLSADRQLAANSYIMTIYKIFRFDAAHYLPNVPADHKCGGMHGHTYTLKVSVSGKPSIYTGWIMDFSELKGIVEPWVNLLDHHVLNDIEGLENPTAEILCLWLWKNLKPELPGLSCIEINETPDSGVVYEG